MTSSPTPEEERALRHDLLILELQSNPQVRARLGRLPWKSADRDAPPALQSHQANQAHQALADPETPRA